MAVGVPINDPAIRHRLVSQLTPKRPPADAWLRPVARVDAGEAGREPAAEDLLGLATVTDQPGPAEARPLTGIVVNRRVSDDEAHLLYWIGFDVVRDTASSFTPDLLHYAQHLRAGGRKSWPPKDLPCPLERNERQP
jgi:hypothetical protein